MAAMAIVCKLSLVLFTFLLRLFLLGTSFFQCFSMLQLSMNGQLPLPISLYAVVLWFLMILFIWVTVHSLPSAVCTTWAIMVQWSLHLTSTHLALQYCYGHDPNKLFLISRPKIYGFTSLLSPSTIYVYRFW